MDAKTVSVVVAMLAELEKLAADGATERFYAADVRQTIQKVCAETGTRVPAKI